MAKGSAIIGKIKGHAGNLVFQVRKGEQIIKTKPGPRGKDHLPTYNQAWNYMRFKWASLMSQVTLELTDHSFTRKYMTQSSTNKFIQANIQNFNPINKKTQNVFDLSTNAPLTFNEIQMSSGTMSPIETEIMAIGEGVGTPDFWFLYGKSYENKQEVSIEGGIIQLPGYDSLQNIKLTSLEDYLENDEVRTEMKAWAIKKGLEPGEMITLCIMFGQYGYLNQGWEGNEELYYYPTLCYIRYKLDPDGETFVVEASNTWNSIITATINYDSGVTGGFETYGWVPVGACIIHSKEVYGGWECSDTIMRRIDPTTMTWAKKATWKQSAQLLYQLEWSTQQMPILDPASLTNEVVNEFYKGRVITTAIVDVNEQKQKNDEEEVIVEGENLEVEKKKKKTSTKSDQE